jgi:pimeloyl-ACP methyl ester carboxylesterase
MNKLLSFIINRTANLFPRWNGKFVFELMCRVKRVGINKDGNDFLDRAVQSKVHLTDYEATVYKFGTGDKNVIFLHGWLSNSQRWQDTIAAIDLREYSCYCIDAPGHGRSAGKTLQLEIYRKFLEMQIAALGSVHAIIGHSLGSLVIAYAYLNEPDLPVNRYIISGAPAGMQSIYDFFQRIMGLRDEVMENMDRHLTNHITTMPAKEINMAHFFRKVKQPVLIIHDHQDRVCPVEFIKEANTLTRPHPAFYTDGLGHDLMDQSVVEQTIDFVSLEEAVDQI